MRGTAFLQKEGGDTEFSSSILKIELGKIGTNVVEVYITHEK
ncbi:hypothetical protein BACEGG_01928 [Bacteroides eggerthii DSM 20697]|nr:hypothetical protein BACEGG_01928 [Bacteroides eggerthii DSM 20697]